MATVDDLRDALRDERARVADLRKRVQDNKYLRFCLVSAAGVLVIVERAISPATMAEPRLASSSAWWLQQTATCSVARGHRSISLRTSWQSFETT